MAKETKKEIRKEAKKEFNKRAFASVFGGFAFIIMALTGLALFSAPSCRIARDTSWTVWGYSKEEVAGLHVWFAIIFAVVAIYHIYLNWDSIKRYFQAKASEGIGFRTEWVAALIICAIVYGGTVRGAWPFSSLVEWKESYKHGPAGLMGQGQGWRGGRGGIGITAMIGSGCSESGSCESSGVAEQGWRGGRGGLGLKDGSGCDEGGSCGTQSGEQKDSCSGTALSGEGADCSKSGTCELQAKSAPAEGFGTGRGAGPGGRGGQFQAQNALRGGMGRMTLSEFCASEGIELGSAITRFRNNGITVRGEMTIRQIADAAGIHPRELRSALGIE